MIEKAGAPYNEKDTNEKLKDSRYKFHIHCYRKFWETSMLSSRAPKPQMDYMIGHQEKAVDNLYAKYKLEVLKATYDEFSYCLSIFSDKKQFVEETMPEVRQQKSTIASLMQEMSEMRLVMKAYEKAMDADLDRRIADKQAY